MTDIAITHEPLTYEQHSAASYFRDLALAHRGNAGSTERLQRHAAEMAKEIPRRRQLREQRGLPDGVEVRVNPNRTDGQGGFFSPPLWLIDLFAVAPRPARVLTALMPSLPLPMTASSVNVPRLTTGTLAGPAADGEAVPSKDIVDAASTQPATPIAGMADVALQLLEQSPAGAHLDWAIFQDLTSSYDAQLETLAINGSGNGTTFQGILNLPTGAGGVNSVSYTDATPTGPESVGPDGQAAAQIGDNRQAPPEIWLMRTARWAWLGSQQDTAQQPFAAPGDAPVTPYERGQGPKPVASLLGWPIYPNDAIPATLGAGANQDAIIACRPTDSMLLESEQSTEVLFEPLSGVLMARLRLHGYATVIYRQPTGIATITGTGLIIQAGF